VPSRARVTLLWFGFLIAVVTYLDRVCISAAAPYITDELRLTNAQMARILSAFALAYAVFEIPSGWLADVMVRARCSRESSCGGRRSRC
jgi:sugar phosphate permease